MADDKEKTQPATANEKADADGKKATAEKKAATEKKTTAEKQAATEKKATAEKQAATEKKATAEKQAAAEKKTSASTAQSSASADDATTKKIIYALCYIFGILFFLPLILYKNDAEATRHANQGLVLLIFTVIGNAVFGILTKIPVIGWLFGVIAGIYSLLLLVLCIVGIVYIVTDQNKELPILGAVHILK